MLKKVFTLVFCSGLFFAPGCSSLVESTRKSLIGSDTPRETKKEVKWVSKAQYDELMDKYKNLSDQHEKLKDENISSSNFNQVDELAEKESASSAETVDVFAKDGLADQASASAPVPPKNLNQDEISQELEYFRKAAALKANGKVDEALKIFQYLERSSTEQVRVRAREHIGDIYMQKGQYDLALQVFEKMIRHDAFSGIVLTALERAVEASEKLNLEQKKAKYQSILKDFFEIEG